MTDSTTTGRISSHPLPFPPKVYPITPTLKPCFLCHHASISANICHIILTDTRLVRSPEGRCKPSGLGFRLKSPPDTKPTNL